MTLFSEKVATDKASKQKLILILEQLGAISKPYYMLQLRHTDEHESRELTSSITFFHVQMPNPTSPIQATISLFNGLAGYNARTRNFMETLSVALFIRKRICESSDWVAIHGAMLGLEMSEIENILALKAKQQGTQLPL